MTGFTEFKVYFKVFQLELLLKFAAEFAMKFAIKLEIDRNLRAHSNIFHTNFPINSSIFLIARIPFIDENIKLCHCYNLELFL